MMSSSTSVPERIVIPTVLAVNVSGFDGSFKAEGNAEITANEIDYYRVQAPESGLYQISATTPSSTMDTVLGVFDAAGNRLASNDDISSSDRDSRASAVFSRGNVYYFAITNYNGSAGGTYHWDVRRTDDFCEGLGGNNTRQAACGLGQVASRSVVPRLVLADHNDWYQFSLGGTSNQGTVEIRFEHDLGDLEMVLFNASGTPISSSLGTGDRETVSLAGRPAGQYYIQVYGHAGATNPFYTLDVNPGGGGFQIDVTTTGFTATQQALIRQAADRWEQIIAHDLPSANFNGKTVDDLLIDLSAVSLGNGILGSANFDRRRLNDGLPYHGWVKMNSNGTGLADNVNSGQFVETVIHEMGHVLGIGSMWEMRNLVTWDPDNPRYMGPQATKAYNDIFVDKFYGWGVPVEATGAEGTRRVHWRESELGLEMMTGWGNAGVEPISRITLGCLADLGYGVWWQQADAFVPQKVLPTGGSWWGDSTAWNPASMAAPLGAELSTSDALSGLVRGVSGPTSWDALASAANPADHSSVSKFDLGVSPGLDPTTCLRGMLASRTPIVLGTGGLPEDDCFNVPKIRTVGQTDSLTRASLQPIGALCRESTAVWEQTWTDGVYGEPTRPSATRHDQALMAESTLDLDLSWVDADAVVQFGRLSA